MKSLDNLWWYSWIKDASAVIPSLLKVTRLRVALTSIRLMLDYISSYEEWYWLTYNPLLFCPPFLLITTTALKKLMFKNCGINFKLNFLFSFDVFGNILCLKASKILRGDRGDITKKYRPNSIVVCRFSFIHISKLCIACCIISPSANRCWTRLHSRDLP